MHTILAKIPKLEKELNEAQAELKKHTNLILELRALVTSIRDCPHSNVQQQHKRQIDNLLSRKFKQYTIARTL